MSIKGYFSYSGGLPTLSSRPRQRSPGQNRPWFSVTSRGIVGPDASDHIKNTTIAVKSCFQNLS